MGRIWRAGPRIVLCLFFTLGLVQLLYQVAAGGSLNHGHGVHIGSAVIGAVYPGHQPLSQLITIVALWLIWRGNWGAWLLVLIFYAYADVTIAWAAIAASSLYVAGLILLTTPQLVLLFAPSVRRLLARHPAASPAPTSRA
jgi:hypothetical protein